MPADSRGPVRELFPHLAVLSAIAAFTLLLASAPQWVLNAGYRCQLQILLGIRCPFCGMTRDFAAMLHGSSPTLNPCSRVVAIVVYGLYPAAVVASWKTGRWNWFSSRAMRAAVGVALGIMMVLNNWR